VIEEAMKRGITVLVSVCLLSAAVYVAIVRWGIVHEPLNFYDASRQRPIQVELSVRRDYQLKADEGFWKLPVAIISNGNTVKNTEYSFLANAFAARGYLVASIQQDNPGDPALMTIPGEPYVGRTGVYKKGEANILFVLDELKKRQPDADYDHLTLVGHSNGGDISMYFAKEHPELVSKVVTLDNLRVPFVENAKMKILSFRSSDPNFKTDPGVLPSAAQAIRNSIDIIRTKFQHTEMSDRGPSSVKEQIQADIDKFLNNTANSELSPASTDNPLIARPPASNPAAPKQPAANQNASDPNVQKATTPNVPSSEAANPNTPKASARGS
jgi:pimeloyl-ACP methyl ester carboxylesterase